MHWSLLTESSSPMQAKAQVNLFFSVLLNFSPEAQLYPLREIQRKLLYANSLTALLTIAFLTLLLTILLVN